MPIQHYGERPVRANFPTLLWFCLCHNDVNPLFKKILPPFIYRFHRNSVFLLNALCNSYMSYTSLVALAATFFLNLSFWIWLVPFWKLVIYTQLHNWTQYKTKQIWKPPTSNFLTFQKQTMTNIQHWSAVVRPRLSRITRNDEPEKSFAGLENYLDGDRVIVSPPSSSLYKHICLLLPSPTPILLLSSSIPGLVAVSVWSAANGTEQKWFVLHIELKKD